MSSQLPHYQQQRPDNRALQTAIEASLQDVRRGEDELVERALRLSLVDETARREEKFEREVEQVRRVSEEEEWRLRARRENDEINLALRVSSEMAEREREERLGREVEEAREVSLREMEEKRYAMDNNEEGEQQQEKVVHGQGRLHFGHGYTRSAAEAGLFAPSRSSADHQSTTIPTPTSSPAQAATSQDTASSVPAAEAARQATLRRYGLVSTADA